MTTDQQGDNEDFKEDVFYQTAASALSSKDQKDGLSGFIDWLKSLLAQELLQAAKLLHVGNPYYDLVKWRIWSQEVAENESICPVTRGYVALAILRESKHYPELLENLLQYMSESGIDADVRELIRLRFLQSTDNAFDTEALEDTLNRLLDFQGSKQCESLKILAQRPSVKISNFPALLQILHTGDAESKELALTILVNVTDHAGLVPLQVLEQVATLSINEHNFFNIREAALDIVIKQMEVQTSAILPATQLVAILNQNLLDESDSIVEKTLKFFRVALEAGAILPVGVTDRLLSLSPNRKTENELQLCMELIEVTEAMTRIQHDSTAVSGVFELSSNATHYGNEKDARKFFRQLKEQNWESCQENDQLRNLIFTGSLKRLYDMVEEMFNAQSKIKPNGKSICDWNAADIGDWSLHLKFQKMPPDLGRLVEMVAVIKHGVFIATRKKPRMAQTAAVLLLIRRQKHKGRLLEISTGEGKSTICAMLAALLALLGETVDVITSSPLLAKRDAQTWRAFFTLFHLKVAYNANNDQIKGYKPCYSENILYGDVSTFQADVLRHEYKAENTRGSRSFGSVIVDEVDSMLIDDSSKLVRLAGHMPGIEYLQFLLAMAWNELERLDKFLDENGGQNALPILKQHLEGTDTKFASQIIIEDLDQTRMNLIEQFLSNTIGSESFHCPNHLYDLLFKTNQLKDWAKSAVIAKKLVPDKHYIIKSNGNYDVIAPVDHSNTGLVQDRTSWCNGLQQFLQLKHSLKLTPENFTTSFISNMAYFKRYDDKIFGMTGTLGSTSAQQLLAEIYNLDFGFIPTYKVKKFEEWPGILAHDDQSWLGLIVTSALAEAGKGRAVLIICQSILDAKKVHNNLKEKISDKKNIRLYSRNDTDECSAVDGLIIPGTIITGTNLAGRGLDVQPDSDVDHNGGLHVIIAFLPMNLRVEWQAKGRTARQGRPGTAQLIINLIYLMEKFGNGVNSNKSDIETLKRYRDFIEMMRLEEVKNVQLQKLKRDDELFSRFCSFTNELRAKNNNRIKLQQLDELWGIKLKQIQEEALHKEKWSTLQEIEEFAYIELWSFQDQIREEYFRSNFIRNPAYLVQEGINKLGNGNRYQESVALFEQAIVCDPDYSFAAYYMLAYAHVRQCYAVSKQKGKHIDLDRQGQAADALCNAREVVIGKTIPQLTAILACQCPPSSQLFRQIQMKINLMKQFISYIDSAWHAIVNRGDENITNIDSRTMLTDLFDEENMPNDEIMELNLQGLIYFFELCIIEPEKSWFDSVAVGLLGAAQLLTGAFLFLSGNYHFAFTLFKEGIRDLSLATSGKGINWSHYLLDKGATIGVQLVSNGIGKFIGGFSVPGIETPFAKFVCDTAVSLVVDYGAQQISEAVMSNFTKEIQEEVTAKVKNSMIYMQSCLVHILAIDSFNKSTRGEQAIVKGVLEILRTKCKAITEIAKMAVTAATRSNHPVINAAGHAAKWADMAYNICKIRNFVDDFCDRLVRKIRNIEKGLIKLEEMLLRRLNGISMAEINDIVMMLKSGGVIEHGVFTKNSLERLKHISLDKFEKCRMRLEQFTKKMADSYTENYKSVIDRLTEEVIANVCNQLLSRINSTIVFPLVHEGLHETGLQEAVSQRLYEVTQYLEDFKSLNINQLQQVAEYNDMELTKSSIGPTAVTCFDICTLACSDNISYLGESKPQTGSEVRNMDSKSAEIILQNNGQLLSHYKYNDMAMQILQWTEADVNLSKISTADHQLEPVPIWCPNKLSQVSYSQSLKKHSDKRAQRFASLNTLYGYDVITVQEFCRPLETRLGGKLALIKIEHCGIRTKAIDGRFYFIEKGDGYGPVKGCQTRVVSAEHMDLTTWHAVRKEIRVQNLQIGHFIHCMGCGYNWVFDNCKCGTNRCMHLARKNQVEDTKKTK